MSLAIAHSADEVVAPPLPPSVRRRRRPKGESFGSCLLMIIIVLGGSMWAYFKFGQNRALVHAGEKDTYTKFKQGEDTYQSDLTYMRKMRETHVPNSIRVKNDVATFINQTVGGKYKEDKEGFEQKKYELVQELRDNLAEINQHTVSTHFETAHVKLCKFHKSMYEALLLAEKGYYKEAPEQAEDYKRAKEAMNKGWREANDAENTMKNAAQSFHR